MKHTILGAGLAGLSTAFHLGHESCLIVEKNATFGGHAGATECFGFTVDQGPHVSFTKSPYVQALFAENVENRYHEFPVQTRSFYQGDWIEHPAQAHLWQIPEPLRSACAREMMAAASNEVVGTPANYQEWLEASYGIAFTSEFPAAYTRKYWTVEPAKLSIDWLGPRMPRLNPAEIQAGLIPGSYQNLHYITAIRYPERGGYQAFFSRMAEGANLELNRDVAAIDLDRRTLWYSDGTIRRFDQLVSTIPLPDFVTRCQQATDEVRQAAAELDCSQLLIVDVFVPQSQPIPGHWFYVYDEDKWSTRIHCVERLAPANAPAGWTGLQVEVYFSRHRPFPGDPSRIAREVARELVTMGFVAEEQFLAGSCRVQWRWARYANIIFTHPRRQALECIWSWLERYGLMRREGDTEPCTDWERPTQPEGSLVMAGRFAEWKYHWTDDCTLRGREIAEAVKCQH